MKSVWENFVYEDELAARARAPGGFFLKVPAGIEGKNELLAAIATAGSLPGWFGFNWDALEESLSDFHWLEEDMIVLLHEDLPLRSDPAGCQIYLSILDTCYRFLRDYNPEPGRSRGRKLSVSFPVCARDEVERIPWTE